MLHRCHALTLMLYMITVRRYLTNNCHFQQKFQDQYMKEAKVGELEPRSIKENEG